METDHMSQGSFDFRLPSSEQAAAMADADQMFLDGPLLPLQLVSQHGQADGSAGPVLLRSLSLDSSQRMIVSASKRHRLTRPASLSSSPSGPRCGAVIPARPSRASRGAVFRTSKLRLPCFGRSRRGQHKGIASRYLKFLVPLYQKRVMCVWRRNAKDDSEVFGAFVSEESDVRLEEERKG